MIARSIAWAFGLLLVGCAHAPSDPGALPEPIDVCVDVVGALPQAARATPSRAGTYDPNAPVDPALLNWRTESFGCVSWPDPIAPRVDCGAGVAQPRVVSVLCQQ
jgi:hypothetical protein